ncbi:MAG: glycosyltransferase family 4 protein [Candidatus Woesearchaeota archaeon]
MKILLLSSTVPEYTKSLFLALKKINKDTYLIYLNQGERGIFEDIENLIKINRPKIRSIKNIFLLLNLKKIINNIKPDIIHIQISYPWFLLLLPFIKCKKIFTKHDVYKHPGDVDKSFYFNEFSIMHQSNGIIVHSSKLKEELRKKNIKQPIYVIPHGNFSIYKPKKIYKEKKNHILFFGRIYEYKGLKYLIEAEPLIKDKIKDFKIVIAGKGEDFSKYEKMIKNKDSFIIHNRYIPDEEMMKLFQESSVVVLPYIEASQSGVIPLAYQFKKPVIATDVGALSDVVINKKTGLLIEPKNVKLLADSIIYILTHPKERKKMGKEGYKFAQKELSWDKIAKKTIEAYKDVLNN